MSSQDSDDCAIERSIASARDFALKHPELARHEEREQVLAEQGIDVPPSHFNSTDMGNAERMAARHGMALRYCAAWGASRRERSLQIVHLAMVQLAKAIAEGEVKMTLADLDKLIRLEAFLSDEPESRHELVLNDLRDKSDRELSEMVKQELEILGHIQGGVRRPAPTT
jgi:hypothetical protein